MKTLTPILAFVIGVALTAVVCSVLNRAHYAQRQAQLLSEVHYPLRQCLDDIARCYDRGERGLAEQKVRLLQKRWSEYLKGGRPPEQFSNEILELSDSATRPATAS